jgi:flagellar M-ring protein FliF
MDLTTVIEKSKDSWAGLNKKNKTVIAFIIIGLLIFSLLTYFFTSRVNWAPLFTNLKLDDAGDIVERLKDMNIRYQLKDSGTTIEIPSDKVYETRLALGREGLPRSSAVGFRDLFSNSSLTSTEWEKRIRYNIALQQDLTDTIQSLVEVREAKVTIVPSQQSIFIDPNSSRGATAAVLLDIRSGSTLSADQVKGIVHLIAHSVEGLSPDNVTVVDKHGRILSSTGSTISGLVSNQLTMQMGFQRDLENSLSSILQQVFGLGNVVVRVNAELNFDERTIEKKLFEPVLDESGILRSINEIREEFSGQGQQASGLPGTDSNIPGYVSPSGSSNSQYERMDVTKNFEINEIRERLVIAPGHVKRINAAVIINQELSDEQKIRISDIIARTIGAQAGRDEISVEGIQFDMSWKDEFNKPLPSRSIIQYLLYALAGVLVIAAAFGLVKFINKPKAYEEFTMAKQQAAAVVEEINIDGSPKSLVKKELEKFAKNKPENFAELIRTWLNEDQR